MFNYAVYKFDFGYLKIGYEDENIVYLCNVDNVDDFGEKNNLTDIVYKQIQEYLSGLRKKIDFPYILYGTDFQKKVWEELKNIPYGETRTYKDIAKKINNKNASRAVGMANNKNPMMIVIPCHRVIGSNGQLVGYAGGLDMKERLLNLERKNSML